MGFNLVTNLNSCYLAIKENPLLLYYSHIPTAMVALLIGIYVFIKNKDSLLSKILLFISVSFALWSYADLSLWTNTSSRHIMFFWSFINLLEMLVSVSTLYFAYVFLENKDVSFRAKLFFIVLLSSFAIFMSTKFNLPGFDYDNCESLQGPLINYYHILEAFFSLFIIIYLIRKIKNSAKGESRAKTIYLSCGVIFFLLSFSGTNVYSSITTQWQVLQYGLFGMVVFMGFLAYLIVQYHAFRIKLIGAQALVVSMTILVGSQYFYATDTTSKVLTTVTLVLSVIFGYILIRSVKRDDERKEQLQTMADKLATANDQLRKLDNAKTEFISIASHQLRTPITAIKGFSSLLLEGSYGEVSESVHGAMEKIYSSAERLVSLIEDLLNVSRLESGRMQFEFKPDKIERLVKELYDNFILIAKEKKFYLDMKLPETPLPEVTMDYVKIRELVSNFMDNALKYTEKGGATIKAEIKDEGVVIDENGFVIPGQKSPFGQMVRITVSDTGIGIPKEEIPYLFKKFSRGKDVARLHVGGTGLGLYVGKAIAEAHHGQVWVESDGAGLGSRFIIEIPVEHVQ